MPGGVCAVLDYETEMMAEYVAEMAMRIVLPNAPVTGAFRKFVSQILTSTRLPSTTILLGMNYLAKRVNMLTAEGTFKSQEGQVWRMLTVSLLLGSKFLDDNTFQNRSWSEVSGIPVSDLNSLEFEWLRHIGWTLYINMDKSHDYSAWLKSWNDWQDNKKRQKQQQQAKPQYLARERLAPIVTNVLQDHTRHHPLSYEGFTHEEIADHERYNMNARLSHASKMNSYRSGDGSWHSQYQNSWSQPQAPLTPPDSGYGTPEYLNSAASANARYNDWFSHALASGGYSRSYHQPAGHSYSRHSAHFSQYYGNYHGGWDSHMPDSAMMSGHSKHGSYFQPNPYGQLVAG